jgi:hypothetical protein
MKVKDVLKMLERLNPESEILLSICEKRVEKPYMKNVRVWPKGDKVIIDGWERTDSHE